MAHNRSVDPKVALPEDGGNVQGPDGPAGLGFLPGGAVVRPRALRQTSIASWKLLPDDAEVLMDAIKYEQDVAAAEAARLDNELLKLHPAPGGWRTGAADTAPADTAPAVSVRVKIFSRGGIGVFCYVKKHVVLSTWF